MSDDWMRCACCGAFLEIKGAWVGESHCDDFANVSCNNPRCKSNKDLPSNPQDKITKGDGEI